jgi:prolyl oligopeptidase
MAATGLVLSCALPASKAVPPPPPPPTEVPVPASPTPVPRTYNYSPAPRSDTVDDYQGTRVADPFRTLEDADDPATVAWVDAENRLTRSLLDRPDRAAIKARLTWLYDYPRVTIPKKCGAFYFFSKNTGLQNQSVYYVQQGLAGTARVLLDPNVLSEDGTVASTNTSPSHDGRLLGYALSRNGSDRQVLYVRDVATGKDLPDKLLWAKFSEIAWTRDNRGFYYTRYPQPGTVPAGDEHYFPKVYYHRIGDPQEKDPVIFDKPAEKEVGVGADVSWDGRWLVLLANRGASNKTEVQIVDLTKPGFRSALVFKGYDHGYRVAEVVAGRLYAWTDRDAPLGRVVSVDLTKIESGGATEPPFREVVAPAKENLQDLLVVNRRLVLHYLRNASSALEAHGLDGRFENEIALPGIGTVSASSGRPDDRDMFFSFVSFTNPQTNFRYDLARRRLRVFYQTEFPADTTRYETEQVWYPSKDGTKISMFLVHRKGLPKDGNRPVLLTAYGGFRVNITPYFLRTDLVFLDKDGLVAVPNLRGGAEYGEEWHKAGMRENKQNVFDDFIAAAEWLSANGWTRPERIAIEGASNGGLLVSAALTQRPDLFGVVVCRVPVADMLRYHRFTVGRYWIPEYGDPDVRENFPFLYRYSPYHRVKDFVVYPSTLITTADTDDRVAPGHAKKLAARLQQADAGENPILIRIETKAGHGSGKPTSKRIDEEADVCTFVFWRLGLN